MRCDTCKKESEVVMRVAVAKDYDRMLARPIYNCPECYEKKEREKKAKSGVDGKSEKA